MTTTWQPPQAHKGFGAELEFHVPSNIDQRCLRDKNPITKDFKFFNKFRTKDRLNDYFRLKSDGTCGEYLNGQCWGGLEINLGIFPLNAKGIDHFENILNHIFHDLTLLKGIGSCQEPFTRKCGFHVHLSDNIFTDQYKFVQLFYQYQRDIFKYMVHSSRNNMTYYARKLQSGNRISFDHCTCVNYNEYHDTLEVRHAGMTSNKESLINWIKFLYLMHNVSQHPEKLEKFQKNEKLIDAIKTVSVPKWFNKDNFIIWVEDKSEEKFSTAF